MADFPVFEENDNRPRQAVDITPPDFAPTSGSNFDPQGDWLKQQWRDADAAKLGAEHPLSLNRDAAEVTSDPYTT